VYLVLFYWCRK